MNKPYEGKDGLARDFARMKYEWDTKLKHYMADAMDEFKEASLIRKPHKFLNFFTEACKGSPFIAGHLWWLSFAINVGLVIALIV